MSKTNIVPDAHPIIISEYTSNSLLLTSGLEFRSKLKLNGYNSSS